MHTRRPSVPRARPPAHRPRARALIPRRAALASFTCAALFTAPALGKDKGKGAKPTVEAEGPSASASEIPALATLLRKAQWEPTPELSGAFQPGLIFEVTALGHRTLAKDCIAAQPSAVSYTAAEIVTSMHAGVQVGGPLMGAAASGELVKKLKFSAPTQRTIPGLDLALTPACLAKLNKQPRELVYRSYVVQEVLQAEIAEQTCGRIDASGKLVGLGAADAELAHACSQASLEPVAVGYRTVPLYTLMGLPAPIAAASAATPVPSASPAPAPTPSPTPSAGSTWAGRSGYTMALVPAGRFTMGSPTTEAGRDENERQHGVTLTGNVWVGTTEVTQGLWRRVMGDNPSEAAFKEISLLGDNLPVQNISWCDAVQFANKLSAADGLRLAYSGVASCESSGSQSVSVIVGADGYRLPTEAEWEHAARAAAVGPYAGGVGVDALCRVGNVWDQAAKSQFSDRKAAASCNDGVVGLARVGSYAANGFGLYDMTGNVFEFVGDWYGEYPSGSAIDPAGPGSGTGRVIRGGAWGVDPQYVRVAVRGGVDSGDRGNTLGMRLVRTAS